MPKKKQFFIKGKEVITDPTAPVISDEFLDSRPEGEYQGQTIEVQAETQLSQDTGTGENFMLRTYEFTANPEIFKNGLPSSQEIFSSHMKGIQSTLWSDGLSPVLEIEPRLIFTSDYRKYLIMVWARPSLGQAVIDTPKTLTEIIHGHRQDRDSLHGGVQLPPAKKKKTKRTA